MLLLTYLKRNAETVASFAERVGRKRHTVYRLIDGSRQPSLELGERIRKETNGLVTPNDFLRVKKSKSA